MVRLVCLSAVFSLVVILSRILVHSSKNYQYPTAPPPMALPSPSMQYHRSTSAGRRQSMVSSYDHHPTTPVAFSPQHIDVRPGLSSGVVSSPAVMQLSNQPRRSIHFKRKNALHPGISLSEALESRGISDSDYYSYRKMHTDRKACISLRVQVCVILWRKMKEALLILGSSGAISASGITNSPSAKNMVVSAFGP